jgi:phage gp36-like protein
MTYGTTIGVKERCDISMEDATLDDMIARAITYADSIIDAQFTKAGTTVASPTPNLIIEAANDIAAYYILRTRNMDQAQKYNESGTATITQYLAANVTGHTGGAKRVTTSQVSNDTSSDSGD